MKTLIISAAEVSKHVTPETAMEAVDYVYREWGKGRVVIPPKIHLDMSTRGMEAWCNAMPAFLPSKDVGGIKWVGGFGENPSHGLPYIRGTIVLTDPKTGEQLAFMDGRLISDMRTGASAAVFSRYLAVPSPRSVLVVGAGSQGRQATRCLLLEYPSAEIRIMDKSAPNAEKLRNDMPEGARSRIQIFEDLGRAAKDADIVVLLTTAQTPILREEWIKPGATVLGMGTYQQVDPTFTLGAEKIVPDYWAQAVGRGELKPLWEAGQITKEHCYAEIAEIAVGRKPGRTCHQERILGLPVGIGAHDVCIAKDVYDHALRSGDGIQVDLS